MNKYIKNYILSVASTVMSLVFPIITFPYVSRVLGPDNLGLVNFAQAYGYYFTHLASFGISSYAIREVSKERDNKEKVDKIANEIFNLNLFFSVISTVLYFAIVIAVPKFRENFILYLIYSVVILSNFMMLDWLLQSYDDYLFTTVRSLIIRTLSVVSVFVFVNKEADYPIYLLISCFAEMGARISNVAYCKKNYISLRLKRKFLNFQSHIKPMFTLFTFRMVNSISTNLDKIMIGFMLTYTNVGIYSAGIKFALMISPIVETVGIVLFPKINIAANSNKSDYYKNLKINYDMILLLGVPMAVGLYLVSPRLIVLFSGDEYFNAISVARIMAIIIALGPIGDMLGSKILLIMKKDKELLICSGIVAVSNVVLNIIFIPIWGVNGAAIASVLSYVVAVLSRLYYAKKTVQFSLISLSAVKYLGFTLPFIVIYILFKQYIDKYNIWMFGFVAISGVIYLLELAITRDYLFDMVKQKLLARFR